MKTWLTSLIMASVIALAPAKAMLITTFVLIVADLVLGLLAARARKERITSAGLRRTVTKLFVYELAIILAFITEVYLIKGAIPLSSIVAGMVGMVELTSCLENLNAISGGELLKKVLKKLGSVNK